MSKEPTTSNEATRPPTTGADSDRQSLFTDLIGLARASTTPSQFLKDAFRSIASSFTSPYAAIHVRFASEVLQDDCHFGSTDPGFWRAALQGFLTDSLAEPRARARLLRDKAAALDVAFLTAPFRDPHGQAIGAIALVVMPVNRTQIDAQLAKLDACSELISYLFGTIGHTASTESGASSETVASSSSRFRAIAQTSTYASHMELAFTITNDLCNKLGCEQVALGLVNGRRIEVLSISGMDSVHRRSPGVVTLRAAMEECLDFDIPIVHPTGSSWSSETIGTGYRLHKQWHTSVNGDSVASIPLHDGDAPVAVLSLRQRADNPFAAETIEKVKASVEPYAAALVVAKRASRGLPRHAVDTVRGGWHVVTGRGRLGTKIATAFGVVASITFLFGSMSYELTVPCTVTPKQVRHLAAPFDAVINRSFVVQGDRVVSGQMLCGLDHRELDQQRTELQAKKAVAAHERDRALADDQPVEAQLAEARLTLIAAQLAIIDRRIEQAAIRAPFDGVVVTGDLRKSIGSVVARGDPLFTIAPLTEWTIELAVPDRVSHDLTSGVSGMFVSYARPDLTRRLTINRVRPAAEVRDGVNVFVAEADIPITDDWMRPGMEGMAKIRFGQRKIWWVTFRRIIDYLHVNFWL